MGLTDILTQAFVDKEKIEERKARAVGVSGLLYSFEETETIEPPTIDTVYRASEIADICPREEVICALKRITRMNKIDAETYFVMRVGSAVHDIVREMLTPFGVLYGRWECSKCGNVITNSVSTGFCNKCHQNSLVYKEDLFKKGYLCGHLDGILLFDGVKYLLEIKTTEGILGMKSPRSEHKAQRMVYHYLSGLNKGIMLYLKRSSLFPIEFTVEYDEIFIKEILAKIEAIKDGIRNKKLPEGICKKDSFRAKTCPVREICELGLL